MGRYTGPVCRLCRRAGDKLFLKGEKCLTPKCAVERRPAVPGEHGGRRRKLSDRGLQLREKQKAKQIYGLLERQFAKHFQEASRRAGVTGDNLLQILETRLDNIVYRLGFAESRKEARQLVSHGHFTVNGKLTNIPSCQLKVGDVVAWKEGSTRLEYYKRLAREIQSKAVPAWLNLDLQTLSGKVAALPVPAELETKIQGKTIVEYYSR